MDCDVSEITREEITLLFIRFFFFITNINKNNFMRNFLLFSHKYHVARNLIINETIIKNIRSI